MISSLRARILRKLMIAKVRMGSKGDIARFRRLHLGCGSRLLNGWANLDSEPNPGICLVDLRKPLPVASSSIELIFSEHFLEHISRDEGRRLLAECYRVLKPGGVIRISTPNLEKLVEQYSLRRITEWHDMNWTPETPCCLLNEGLRLWGHQFVYDSAELTQALRDAGFRDIDPRSYRISAVAGLHELETRPFHDEIIVEATKI